MMITYVASYPPRECGIATFTRDLSESVALIPRQESFRVAAINEEESLHHYPAHVKYLIDQGDPQSYIEAAKEINASNTDIVSVQHEFGLYGVWDGTLVADHLAPMLEALKKPVVTTLHTVLPYPDENIKRAMRAIWERSDAVTVMVRMAGLLLMEDYGLPAEKIYTIAHGVPQVKHRVRPDKMKREYRLEGRVVISTFGLLSEGKGIDLVIDALPSIVERTPNVIYLIIGETHPEVRKRQGEEYRNNLLKRIKDLGMANHVRFVNRFLPQEELVSYLLATDVYVTPYVNRHQITSGTLAYALGCGKAIVSTPYLYAQEALAEGRGMLAEFRSSESIANCINQILLTPGLKEHMEREAYRYGRQMAWGNVGRQYYELFGQLVPASKKVSPIRKLSVVNPADRSTDASHTVM